MNRTYTHELKPGPALVKGWVDSVRDKGSITFALIRDREGTIQTIAKKGKTPEPVHKALASLGREDCVAISGTVVANTEAPGGRELIPESISVLSKAASPLPLDFSGPIRSAVDKRFAHRFLDLRNPQVQALFRVRDSALSNLRGFFAKEGLVEVHTPVIQAAGAEGGATLFPLQFYGKKAYLRQSPQLYKQMLMATGLDKVYEIGPVFRAEKFHTRRHVSEFLSVDVELAWIESEEDVLKFLERCIVSVAKGVAYDAKPSLDILGATLSIPELPFPRLTYDDALSKLAAAGTRLEWGADLGDPEEKLLGELMAKAGHKWYFITKYPAEMKPFYIMADGRISRGFDLDCAGLELASGGQREHRADKLTVAMKKKDLDPKDFDFYVNAFQWGMPSHAGFG
ncbi:MAG TPA: aspartate--tRNA(Asn) ligase, partial [archaeon]|nr:aspartate--tRNA(Asn) ligase [archaeon]